MRIIEKTMTYIPFTYVCPVCGRAICICNYEPPYFDDEEEAEDDEDFDEKDQHNFCIYKEMSIFEERFYQMTTVSISIQKIL